MSRRIVIGICGEMRHGKDTIADILTVYYNFYKRPMAYSLKEAVKVLFGFNREQLYGSKKEDIDNFWNVSPRKVLQVFGTEIMRNYLGKAIEELSGIGSDFWVQSWLKWFLDYSVEPKIVVPDIRFQNELDAIRNLSKYNSDIAGYVFKVVRPDLLNRTDEKNMHPSEAELRKIPDEAFDKVFINNTTISNLQKNVIEYISKNILTEDEIWNTKK